VVTLKKKRKKKKKKRKSFEIQGKHTWPFFGGP
jgi:hypothetical protein